METRVRVVEGTENDFDFDARYQEARRPGVAFVVLGWAQQWSPTTYLAVGSDGEEYEADCEDGDGEWVDDFEHVVAVMVGDDHRWTFELDDLEAIPSDSYCHDCGQIGCGWNTGA